MAKSKVFFINYKTCLKLNASFESPAIANRRGNAQNARNDGAVREKSLRLLTCPVFRNDCTHIYFCYNNVPENIQKINKMPKCLFL